MQIRPSQALSCQEILAERWITDSSTPLCARLAHRPILGVPNAGVHDSCLNRSSAVLSFSFGFTHDKCNIVGFWIGDRAINGMAMDCHPAGPNPLRLDSILFCATGQLGGGGGDLTGGLQRDMGQVSFRSDRQEHCPRPWSIGDHGAGAPIAAFEKRKPFLGHAPYAMQPNRIAISFDFIDQSWRIRDEIDR